MPHNSIPGHGEHHETPAAGSPTAIAAQHAGQTPDAYAAQHGTAPAQEGAQLRQEQRQGPPQGRRRTGSVAARRSTSDSDLIRTGPGLRWYEDERVGLVVTGVSVVGLLVTAWYLHRDDDDRDD